MIALDVVLEERYWYPDDGGEVWVAGYTLVEPSSGRYLGREDAWLAERGLHVTGVAGAARYHAQALAAGGASPGSPLTLRRDAANEHDPHAIAVDLPGGPQLGWVARELAASVASSLDAGDPWSALVLREQRLSPRDPRTGVTMLLAPADGIELRVRAG